MLMAGDTFKNTKADRILIEDLLVRCIIGVTAEERRDKQDVIVNIELCTDLSQAAKSDRIEDAVAYDIIKKRVFEFVQQSGFSLLEALAQGIVLICLESSAVIEASVRVAKPGALRFARSVAVEMTRRQESNS